MVPDWHEEFSSAETSYQRQKWQSEHGRWQEGERVGGSQQEGEGVNGSKQEDEVVNWRQAGNARQSYDSQAIPPGDQLEGLAVTWEQAMTMSISTTFD